MQEVYLTDLIGTDMLQKMQDSFAKMTGLAALTTDVDGKPVTKGSNFTDYCMKYTRKSKLGCERCEKCDKFGAETTMKNGVPTTYRCHSGLIDFAAPIMAGGQLVGCFIGGQVLTEKPDKEYIKSVADEIGVDFEKYWEALEKVPIMEREQIDSASEFLFTTAGVLSDIAYGKYMALEAKKEVERAANLKADFLANMSHEIRTPMNAVVGMAEMALRENLTPAAKEYITQIKSSGSALLNIINDILDFSKIDSGKMDIQPVEYEPLSLFNDVANIVMTRLKDKDVELVLSLNHTLPRMIYGDNVRIRQILINLADNAVKYTRQGHVDIILDYDKIDEENICMKVAVKDTGIGIKQNDLEKIFQSFQQVDSKRNRNIEGTGLGLTITQRLLSLMNGSIHVSSVYEEGSVFSFELPQKVLDWEPSFIIKNASSDVAIGYFGNKYFEEQFFKDVTGMGVDSVKVSSADEVKDLLRDNCNKLQGKRPYLFIEEENYDEQIERIISSNKAVTCVMLTDFYSNKKSELSNLSIIRKPLSSIQIALALNDEEMHLYDESKMFEFDFIAPSADVLLVDDNAVNLTVAEGLLEPLQMRIVTATSGKKALELIEEKHFDIIFMDHMMPELDGVETTRIIRRLHPEYSDVPIIALTANVVDGAREMFLSEGMNDFVAKPIEVKIIVSKIKKWLPAEKIEKGNVAESRHVTDEDVKSGDDIVIGDLDTAYAKKMLGNDKLFRNILNQYYKAIPAKTELIRESKLKEDWKSYTIEVHALKSASKQIGAMELSDMAAELEKAGNEHNVTKIKSDTDALLNKYTEYIDILKPFCEEEKDEVLKDSIGREQLEELFDKMLKAVDNLDADCMEEVVAEMDRYSYMEEQNECLGELKEAVGNLDVDNCSEIIDKWRLILI